MKKISFILRIIAAILLIALGVVMIIRSCNGITQVENSTFTESHTYGGDAYTGIQNALADTANGVNRIVNQIYYVVWDVFSDACLFVGLFLIIFSIFSIAKTLKNYEQGMFRDKSKDYILQLKEYKALLDMGAITAEDYDAKKRELISNKKSEE